MHIAIDASSWANERGFGRVTRCLVAALAARDAGFTYTLLFDAEPTYPVPDGGKVQIAGAGSMAASGGDARVRGQLATGGQSFFQWLWRIGL